MRRGWLVVWACISACATGSDEGVDFPPTLSMGLSGGGTSGGIDEPSTESEGDPMETSDGSQGDSEGADETGCTETLWWIDLDGDGHGDPAQSVASCTPVAGHVPVGDDCNDGDPLIHPAHPELCDDKDNDCDGLRDEASDANTTCHGCDMFNFGAHGYAFCPGGTTWSTAQSNCDADFQANLVAIDDPAEQAALAGFASGTDFWIGASDRNQEGTFRWVDGTVVGYALWDGDQPDDYQGEDCVEMRQEFSYRWNDLDCSDPRGAICEIQ